MLKYRRPENIPVKTVVGFSHFTKMTKQTEIAFKGVCLRWNEGRGGAYGVANNTFSIMAF